MAITRRLLSGQTGGAPVTIGISQTGTEIHVATSANTTTLDEVYLWAQNRSSASNAVVGITFGVSGTGNEMQFVLAPREVAQIIPGWTLPGSTSATSDGVVRVFNVSGCANVIGFVNRIS